MIYANLAAQVKYTFNQLAGDTPGQVRHFVCDETWALDGTDLNVFLKPLKRRYDDPDWVGTAAREVRALKQKNQPFSTYLKPLSRIL